MKNTKRKGFTIVELVIVIAVIAILAAVLIPTFASLVKKANLSADQQAAKQMNTALAMCVDAPATIADAKFALSENDIDANNYKPLSTGYDYYWVPSLNRVILVDDKNEVAYPADIATKATELKGTWYSLSGSDNNECVKNIKDGINSNKENITLADTNFYGASINLDLSGFSGNNITIGGSDVNSKATISNMVSDEGSRVNAGKDTMYAGHSYYCGLISQVPAGKTVTIQNLIIDGAVIGDTTNSDSARAGIIAGDVSGTLIIKNVIIKNCTVFGQYRVGALVGGLNEGGEVKIENVTVESTTVKGCQVTAALIGGVKSDASVSFSNVETKNIKVVFSDFNNDGKHTTVYKTNAKGDKFVEYPGHGYYAYLTDSYMWVEKTTTTCNKVEDMQDESSSTDLTKSQ